MREQQKSQKAPNLELPDVSQTLANWFAPNPVSPGPSTQTHPERTKKLK